jgi:hypothetical protein
MFSSPCGDTRLRWSCLCDCGNTTTVPTRSLTNGQAKSCGCLGRDRAREVHTKHGLRNSPEYRCWSAMLVRCRCESNKDYPRYGARGVTVDRRWLSFENFVADMGPRPSPKHSIDRIDVNGGYGPHNCRWATAKEQANNRRNTRSIHHAGRRWTVSELAESSGIPLRALYARLFNHHWPVQRAISQPISEPIGGVAHGNIS